MSKTILKIRMSHTFTVRGTEYIKAEVLGNDEGVGHIQLSLRGSKDAAGKQGLGALI